VSNRFALREFDSLGVEGSLLTLDGTNPPAVGAGLFVPQCGGLTLQKGLESAFGDSLGGGVSDLLHHCEIDIESGTLVAEGASGDDFSPLSGEEAKLVEFARSERTSGHETSCQEVTAKPI
jgi:hypothetical protein